MKKIFKIRVGRLWSFVAALTMISSLLLTAQVAYASNLSNVSVTLTNMVQGGNSAIIFFFKTSAGNTGTTLTLQFPQYSGGANGSVAGSQTYSQTYNTVNCTNAAIAGSGTWHNLPGTPTASGSGTTITFASMTALTGGSLYCGVLTGSAVTNPTAATTSDTAVLTAGTDSATTVSIDILASDTVSVTATVPPTFTLAIGSSTDNFTANLSTGSTGSTSGVLLTVNTNAKSGYFLYGSDSNTGLTSASASHTITAASATANGTLSNGSEGYDSGATITQQGTGSGTTTLTTPYNSSGAGNGAGFTTGENLIATSNGTATNAEVTVKEYATIAGATPPGTDYTDTLTFVGAGAF
jgi:hypothetical protein